MKHIPTWQELFWFSLLTNILMWACLAVYLNA